MNIKKRKYLFYASTSIIFISILAWYCLGIIKNSAQAYLYSYPLVLMNETHDLMVDPKNGRSPENHFTHIQSFPNASFRQVVRPNNDTLYSVAWIDVEKGPVILSVPDTQGRYYVMPFMDAWTNVFTSIGSRNTGTKAGNFLISNIDWQGEVPVGTSQIKSPTNRIWLIGRIQTNTSKDYENVRLLQNQFKLSSYKKGNQQLINASYNQPTLLNYLRKEDNKKSHSIDPNVFISTMSANEFFKLSAKLMNHIIPASDHSLIRDTLKTVGIFIGNTPSYNEPNYYKSILIKIGVNVARKKMQEFISSDRSNENGWAVIRENIGRYNQAYAVRAIVAQIGLGALPPEDAAYPTTNKDSEGLPLNGQFRYRLHFPTGNLPPVKAFWSLTMYDQRGFFVENSIKRYAIGDRDPLVYNQDGSLDLYIQNDPPKQLSNWLPSSQEDFALTLRLYQPKDSFLNSTWQVPAIIREK